MVSEHGRWRICYRAIDYSRLLELLGLTAAFEAATAADLDGDGDADVISAVPESGKIAWYENTDGQGTFVRERVITANATGVHSIYAADMDGDGDIDIGDATAWYANTDGKGTFGA